MVFARIVYRNKTGWKTGKHVYYMGTMEQLEAVAKKNARGREYQIQTDFSSSHVARMFGAGAVEVLE